MIVSVPFLDKTASIICVFVSWPDSATGFVYHRGAPGGDGRRVEPRREYGRRGYGRGDPRRRIRQAADMAAAAAAAVAVTVLGGPTKR